TTTANITARSITGSLTAQDKTYDGTTAAATSGSLSGVIAGDAVTLATSGVFTDKNAGNGKTVNLSASLAGRDAGNYALQSYNTSTLADIARASLTITALDASKTVGQLAQLNGYNVLGLLPGDVLASVTLASPGADAAAAPGDYAILPSAASGLGLGNYLITYRPGVLAVQGLPAALVETRTASFVPLRERPTLTLPAPTLAESNGLSGLPGLDVVNRGIRLPEGI
ncbi:YDG domain-containing protein, partial [Pseudomonas oryzihabitans]|uniref:YDG domain-containing protein n=1 Tax=Pseudomonas oryzihabitans TaxID=47885 RepID=UPI002894E592